MSFQALFTRLDWGSTRVDDVVGIWTRRVSDWSPGVVQTAQFVVDAPWLGGQIEVADPLPGGRQWSITVDSELTGSTPTSTRGAEFDEFEDLQALFNPLASAEVEFKFQRLDSSGATVSRSIWTRCTALHPYRWMDGDGEIGTLGRGATGIVRYKVDLFSRFPFWRDTTLQDETWAATTGGATQAITNDGLPCGARWTIDSVTGGPTAIALSNNANSYTLSNNATPLANDYFDANHTSPTAVSTVGDWAAGGYVRIETGSQTLTATTTGGGSSAGVTIAYRRNWGTP